MKSRSEYIKLIPQITPIKPPEEEKKEKPIMFSDFKLHGVLGQGSYGKVFLAEKDGKRYALKQLSKSFILKVL